MALEPDQILRAGDLGEDAPPVMLRRPADAPPPLPALRGTEVVRVLHERWAHAHGPTTPAPAEASLWRRARRKARRSIPLGRVDPQLVGGLIRAVDAIALRCDEMADRLAVQEALMEDVMESFGQDITLLRAEFLQWRADATPTGPTDG